MEKFFTYASSERLIEGMDKIASREKGFTVETDRRKEVIDICLDAFVSQGLAETTSRDLSSALKLQSGGLYYYFKSKDDAVVACAEEAAVRLEDILILPALKDVDDPDIMIESLRKRADEMAPTMKFLAQVCSTPKYNDSMKPALSRLCKRYVRYAEKFADKLHCDVDEISPYVYLCITAVSNYMIFGEQDYISPQMRLIKNEIIKLKNNAGA